MDFTEDSPEAIGGSGGDWDNDDIDEGSRGHMRIWPSDEAERRCFPVRARENIEEVWALKVVM